MPPKHWLGVQWGGRVLWREGAGEGDSGANAVEGGGLVRQTAPWGGAVGGGGWARRRQWRERQRVEMRAIITCLHHMFADLET